ncbi:MAG TPA: glycosyltransferase family 2 protein [Marinagarivorans sp.]
MKPVSCEFLVVIVNYGTPKDVVDCLASLKAEIATVDGAVVVVDNCSPDDSVSVIEAAIEASEWSSWAQVVKAGKNGGFAYGNNLAVRPAMSLDKPPKYFHLLNPDTLVEPGALSALRDFLEANPRVGIAGSRQKIYEGDWNNAFRFPCFLSEVDRGLQFGPFSKVVKKHLVLRQMSLKNEVVDWVSGASMIVRREVFDDVGLMDENYFLYYEETDFCLNASRAGWDTWHVPNSVVFHKVGASTGVKASNPVKRIPSYVFQSRSYYFKKNYGVLYALFVDSSFILAVCGGRLINFVFRRKRQAVPFLLRDSICYGAFGALFK